MNEREYIIATNQARLSIALDAIFATLPIPGDERSKELRAQALAAVSDLLRRNTKAMDDL